MNESCLRIAIVLSGLSQFPLVGLTHAILETRGSEGVRGRAWFQRIDIAEVGLKKSEVRIQTLI